MASKKENNEFIPMIAIPPGETIRENMEYLGMNQEQLACKLGITQKHLSNIINGKSPITYETALSLEDVIGPSAQFWMNLECQYQLTKARLDKENELSVDLEIIKNIDYNKMSSFGWVNKVRDKAEKVKNCRRFFGVANLSLIQKSYSLSFRMHKMSGQINDLNVLAWIRKAELNTKDVEISDFNKSKLTKMIPRFRELTMEDPKDFYPEMVKLCSECGIALTLVEYMPKTSICGATIWKKNKAILALSVRGKRADIFWFTFFHEIAHLISHTKKENHINYEKDESEDEADSKARQYLIPDDLYNKFVTEYDFTDKNTIIRYSENIGVAPCILVGRLLHDRLIDYRFYSDLRPSFTIVTK